MSESSPEKEPGTPQRKLGCLAKFALMCLCALLTLVAAVFAIDRMNQGPAIQNAITEIIANSRKTVVVEKVVEKVVKPPLPSGYMPHRNIDTTKLWNGLRVQNSVETAQGDLASEERIREDAIQLEMKLTFKIPRASQTMEELEQVNPNLSKILPALPAMVENCSVSPFYHQLYENKTRRMQENATRFSDILSVHNLYDTETILELENAETKQKILLVQSDMDVVADGSDGDRWPFLDNYITMSTHYQPFTSYGWAKQTDTPNPLLARWQSELDKRKKRFAVKGLSIKENRFLRSRIAKLEPEIEEMKVRSNLIAEADPFIVISLVSHGRHEENEYCPLIGDYAVVIHENNIYPAIAGDYGPSFKYGEASLRIAKEINSKASPYHRPESDLEVTYLIFPNSRDEKKSAPDLEKWHRKCQEHIDLLGGLGAGYSLHEWEDIIPVKLDEWRRKNDPDYAEKKSSAAKSE